MQNYNSNGVVNSSSDINIPYGWCLLPSNSHNRQGAPGPDIFGNGKDYTQCIPQIIQPASVIGPQNTSSVNNLDQFFLQQKFIPGLNEKMYSNTDLQPIRPDEPSTDYYISLASETLHVKPDLTFSIFFSDANINHLRETVVKKVKEITSQSQIGGNGDGVDIKTPNMDDFFNYLVSSYQNYKINNGSICFVNLRNGTDYKSEIAKLNSNVLQEYVSKMISQINMYVYYYQDASQLPGQLSLPVYTSMRSNNKVLEYNTGFKQGNSLGMASYDQVGNIF